MYGMHIYIYMREREAKAQQDDVVDVEEVVVAVFLCVQYLFLKTVLGV